MENRFELLQKLLHIAAPTGKEEPVQRLLYENFSSVAEKVQSDIHGNLCFGLNVDAPCRVMLEAHCDQIAFMVKHIDADGFLYLAALGGPDLSAIPGDRVRVLGGQGEIPGVIGKKSSIEETASERKEIPPYDQLWVDIGAKDLEAAAALAPVGSYVYFEPRCVELAGGRVSAVGLDNRAGVFAVFEAFRRCSERELPCALWAVSSVQEEVGLRGAQTAAFALKPTAAITVDVTTASDSPGSGKLTTTSCELGKGPSISRGPNTNPRLEELVRRTAEKRVIPYQIAPSAELESNTSKAIQVASTPVATLSLSIPVRYMHTPIEVADLADIAAAADLLTETIAAFDQTPDFRPFSFGDPLKTTDFRAVS